MSRTTTLALAIIVIAIVLLVVPTTVFATSVYTYTGEICGGDSFVVVAGKVVRNGTGLIYYDDFSTLDTTKWIVYKATGYSNGWSVVNGQLKCDLDGTSTFGLIILNITAPPRFVLECKMLASSAYGVQNFFFLFAEDASYFYVAPARVGGKYIQLEYWDKASHTATSIYGYQFSWSPDVWYDVKLVYDNGAVTVYVNGIKRLEYTLSGVSPIIGLAVDNAISYFDDFRVMKSNDITVYGPPGSLVIVKDSNGNVLTFAVDNDNDGVVKVDLQGISLPMTGSIIVVTDPWVFTEQDPKLAVWGGDKFMVAPNGLVRIHKGLKFYDSFDILNTTLWTYQRGTWGASSGYVYVTTDVGSAPGNWLVSTFTVQGNEVIELHGILGSGGDLGIILAQGTSTQYAAAAVEFYNPSTGKSGISLNEWDGSAWLTATQVSGSFKAGDVRRIKVLLTPTTITLVDVQSGLTCTRTLQIGTTPGLKLGLHNGAGFTTASKFDWIAVYEAKNITIRCPPYSTVIIQDDTGEYRYYTDTDGDGLVVIDVLDIYLPIKTVMVIPPVTVPTPKLPSDAVIVVHDVTYSPKAADFNVSFTATNLTYASYTVGFPDAYGFKVVSYNGSFATLKLNITIDVPYGSAVPTSLTLYARTNATGVYRRVGVRLVDAVTGTALTDVYNITLTPNWQQTSIPVNEIEVSKVRLEITIEANSSIGSPEEVDIKDIQLSFESTFNPATKALMIYNNPTFNISSLFVVDLGSSQYLNASTLTFKVIDALSYVSTMYPIQPTYVGTETIGGKTYNVYQVVGATYPEQMLIQMTLPNMVPYVNVTVSGVPSTKALVMENVTVTIPVLGNITIPGIGFATEAQQATIQFPEPGIYEILANRTNTTAYELGYAMKKIQITYGVITYQVLDVNGSPVDYDYVYGLLKKNGATVAVDNTIKITYSKLTVGIKPTRYYGSPLAIYVYINGIGWIKGENLRVEDGIPKADFDLSKYIGYTIIRVALQHSSAGWSDPTYVYIWNQTTLVYKYTASTHSWDTSWPYYFEYVPVNYLIKKQDIIVNKTSLTYTKLAAGKYTLDLEVAGVKVGTVDLLLNIFTNGTKVNVTINALDLGKGYRGVGKAVFWSLGSKLLRLDDIDPRFPLSRVSMLLNGTGDFAVVLDYYEDLPTKIDVESNTTLTSTELNGTYLIMKGVFNSSAEINVTDLYKITVIVKDRLGDLLPVPITVTVNSTSYPGPMVTDYKYPSPYIVAVPFDVSGFKFFDWVGLTNETAVTITVNHSDVTITCEYRVPTSIHLKTYKLQSLLGMLGIPFIQQNEGIYAYIEGVLMDYYGNPVPKRPVNVTVIDKDTSIIVAYWVGETNPDGYFKTTTFQLAPGRTYIVKVAFPGDTIYVETSTEESIVPEQLPVAPMPAPTDVSLVIGVVVAAAIISGLLLGIKAIGRTIEIPRKFVKRKH